jgi:HAE1 family hydrophobic/amphiphilic exporter-1
MFSVSGSLPYEQLASQADIIKQSLERLEGVGTVTLEGELEKELQINIDKTKLDYYGISLNTVVNKLKAENLNVPLGEIKQPASSQPLQVKGEFKDIKEVQGLRIPIAGGAMVPLADIAEVSLGYADPDQKLRLNGETSIGIFVQKQSDANIVAVTERVKNILAEMNKKFPEGLHLSIASDKSAFINATLTEVKKNLIEAIAFTALIMLLFLRNWRTSLIVLVSIPTSLIAAFFMMYVFGFSLNIITILALSICIGILVDDSIVVLENIQRHMKMGKSPIQAAIEGRKEIAMAAIAITLCDVVVFGPVAFLTDIVGQFFRQFGLTVVVATLFSLAVSFTITPMLSAKLIKGETRRDAHQPYFDKVVGL